jgi:hypothetical protein
MIDRTDAPCDRRSGPVWRERRSRPRRTRLWEQVRDKILRLQECLADEAERRRIHQALGRPVRRPVLDPEGHVILEFGEPVTGAAVTQARGAGVLPRLLAAIDEDRHER